MNEHRYAEIALGLPVDKLFHYRIPESVKNRVSIGKRAWVPFRNNKKIGYIVGLKDTSDVENVKPLLEIIDEEPLLDADLLTLTKKIADYYFASWGQVIEASIPSVYRKGKLDMGFRKTKTETRSYHEEPIKSISLMEEQARSLDLIIKSLTEGKSRTFLLYGITASGKTEIYLRTIEKCLQMGKASIVLVPEISLTPQTVARFKSRFKENVAVLHSRLSEGVRFYEWGRINRGEAKIVVGARSAIFSPVKNLGVIILDEENDTSYKQEETPRYHAREVAIMKAELSRCPLILGSATPSLEAYYKTKENEFKLLRLTKRIHKMELPKVNIIDMKKELLETKKVSIFSRVLKNKIEETLQKNQQVILFLNRRGFSTFVNCKNCGYAAKCSRCDSILVYHHATQKLTCHWCNSKIDPPKICPSCRSSYINYFGLGTEKVEEELRRILPYTKIGRMDTDSTRKKGTHEKILGEFRNGDIKVLIGTQMIAKGLDFPNVTLVGVISADTALNLPDFRASEKTFSLLTQVAGRAGRGELGGEVVIQTYAPHHYAITSSLMHDYNAFFEKEINSRKDLDLPPFCHLTRITLQARSNKNAFDSADELAKTLKKITSKKKITIMGPAQSVVSKLRGLYRWNLMMKSNNILESNCLLKEALATYARKKGVMAIVDVDPMSI